MAQGMMRPAFQTELARLVNKHGLDNDANTPDFILAGMMVEWYETFRKGKDAYEQWFSSPPQRIEGSRAPDGAPWYAHQDGPCGPECEHAPGGSNHPVVPSGD
jgi:hypothetical protein